MKYALISALIISMANNYTVYSIQRTHPIEAIRDYAQQQLDLLARNATTNQATTLPTNAFALLSTHVLSKEFLSAVIARIPQEREMLRRNAVIALDNLGNHDIQSICNNNMISIDNRVKWIDDLIQMHNAWQHIVDKNLDDLPPFINASRKHLIQLKTKFSEHMVKEQKLLPKTEKTITFITLLEAEADSMLTTLSNAEKLIQQSSLPLYKSFALPSCL